MNEKLLLDCLDVEELARFLPRIRQTVASFSLHVATVGLIHDDSSHDRKSTCVSSAFVEYEVKKGILKLTR